MKAIVLISSIFFLLGLKLSSVIDLRKKAETVDTLITTKIIQSKPVKALPLFGDSEKETKENKKTEEKEVKTQTGFEEAN